MKRLMGVWRDVDSGRCDSAPFPSLVRRGGREAPGVVCSKSRSHLMDAREALLINRYCSTLNRPPQPSLREGIPALLRRGMESVTLDSTASMLRLRKYRKAHLLRSNVV